MIVGGFFLLGPGIPLWIAGGQGEAKYNQKLKAVSVRTNLNPRHAAIAVTYRF
jgi:hypothetical protein